MLLLRTFCCVKMNDLWLWVFAVIFQTLLLPTSCGIHNHRRSTAVQGGLPVSKGGWRPVIGSSGLFYGAYSTSQLHSPYKIPIPVMDTYQSSSRPAVAKDSPKITSIAQSYRPTTLRTVSAASSAPVANQPISTYHNPFALQNNAFSNYKFIQNYPAQSVLVRNPHNPYADRNIYSKYPTKLKQNNHLQNAMLQQLTNIQPIQFGQYQAAKPLDIFGKPIETYARPTDGKKHQSSNIETFKPEVFKLDNDAAPQSFNQQIKTAQQHGLLGLPNIGNPYPQYTFQNTLLSPNVLGTFGTFGGQSVKGREPIYQFPTTFGPSQQTKQIFNSYNYSPTYKTTPTVFDATTPRAPITSNQISFGTSYRDSKITPTPQTKLYVPPKIDPNADYNDGFKPSPQDPYSKNYQSNFNKVFVTTYNPAVQTTTLANNYYEYSFPIHQNQQSQSYQDQPNKNINYETKKNVLYDSVTAGNQQPTKTHSENVPSPYRPTYEVTEATDSEFGTRPTPTPWSVTPVTYDYNSRKTVKELDKKQEFVETLGRPGTTTTPDLPEEFAIVTEAEKGYGNSLSYDGRVESQSRRPVSDDFEAIGMNKLKDYYYKVSTPIYDDYSTSTRTKPTESAKYTSTQEITTLFNNNKENNIEQIEALPTLPPNQHFKRPGSSVLNEKDRIRKRNKVRRRRPQGAANINHNKEEASTRFTTTTVSTTAATPTTDVEEVYTIRPRIRTTKSPPYLTTPTVTTDLTTSALPTISPTIPTIVKKKLAHRRPVTTTPASPETTSTINQDDLRQDSQIMKITSRTHLPKLTYDYKNDFTHKQDEKDTPTSDVTVSLSDTLKTTVESEQDFSFHKDFKPIEAKLEPMKKLFRETTTAFYKEEGSEYTTTPRSELTETTERSQRPRLRNKFHRNRFNVKDYRSRLSSTTSTTEQPAENIPKIRYPQRRLPYSESENETTTERKKFVPKEPRHRIGNGAENNEQTEKDIHSFNPSRQRQTTTDNTEPTTVKVSSRVRNGQRRPRPPADTTETNPTTIHTKRPLRKKILDSEVGESVQDISVTENFVDEKNEITSERTRSESAIMKIADKKHHDHIEHLFEHSKRVSDLTLAASKDYNKPGMFKTVSSSSRRIPNYFTIATDDPILPIEAFFPQLNQKKEW